MDQSNPVQRRQREPEQLSSDATQRLLHAKQILFDSVQASNGTLTSLATSSQSVKKNEEELKTQNVNISTSHSLLKTYGRRASTDKLLIWLALIFFGCVVLYIVNKRLL